MMSRARRLSALGLSATVLGTVFVTATPASAGIGYCRTGDVCLYYESDFKGGRYGMGESGDYTSGIRFGSGDGSGEQVKNNAESVHNLHSWKTATIYYNSGQSCRYTCDVVAPHEALNLTPWMMRNENASQKLAAPSNKPQI